MVLLDGYLHWYAVTASLRGIGSLGHYVCHRMSVLKHFHCILNYNILEIGYSVQYKIEIILLILLH